MYIVGGVNGALPGQTFAGARDVFVRKLNPGGEEKWTAQFGTAGLDNAFGAFVSGGALLITGQTSGALSGQTYSGGPFDAFVRGYDTRTGQELWTHQFGTAGLDIGGDVFAAGSSRIFYIGGLTNAALPGQTHAGLLDAYLMKLVVTE